MAAADLSRERLASVGPHHFPVTMNFVHDFDPRQAATFGTSYFNGCHYLGYSGQGGNDVFDNMCADVKPVISPMVSVCL